MRPVKNASKIATALVVGAILIGAIWIFKRYTNDALWYSGSTEETVCKMVRADQLTLVGREICAD